MGREDFVNQIIVLNIEQSNNDHNAILSTNEYNNSCITLVIQSTSLNQVTLVPEHFDPIKRNLGVDPIKRSELILFLWFCSWPSDPINRWPKLNR